MKLGYVIVYVADVAGTVAFYEKAFGLERRFIAEGGVYGELETGSTALAFASNDLVEGQGLSYIRNDVSRDPAGIEIALVAEDVPAALARAKKAGARVIQEPKQKPWGQTVAYVRDLNGVLVELCTPVST